MAPAEAWPWEALLGAWGFFALQVMSPGPNVFNTIGLALGSGRRAGLAAAAAIGPGVLLWGAAATLGAAALFRAFPAAEAALALAGGALLLWFGARYLRRAAAAGPEARARGGVTPREAFLRAVAILVANPKALTTWLMILTLFPAAHATAGPRAALVLGMAAIAGFGHALYALAFSSGPAAALYARAARWIDAGVGLAFVALGAKLIAGRLAALA